MNRSATSASTRPASCGGRAAQPALGRPETVQGRTGHPDPHESSRHPDRPLGECHGRDSGSHRTAGQGGRRVGRRERHGQIEMAKAVAHAFDTGEHLAVQAGTGTGKSLAYLVPAIARADRHRRARGRVDRDDRAAAPARRPRPAAAGRCPRRRPAPSPGVRSAEGTRKLPVPQQDSQRRRRPNRRTGRRRSCSTRWPPPRWAATCSG